MMEITFVFQSLLRLQKICMLWNNWIVMIRFILFKCQVDCRFLFLKECLHTFFLFHSKHIYLLQAISGCNISVMFAYVALLCAVR